MPDIPAFIVPPKKQGFFANKSTNIPTPEPLSQIPVESKKPAEPVEQTPPPASKKPGFFSRIAAPVKNFFAPKPAPEPTVNNTSTINLPSTTNETVPLQYNPATNNYEPMSITSSTPPATDEAKSSAHSL
jgi:hypothetical protein